MIVGNPRAIPPEICARRHSTRGIRRQGQTAVSALQFHQQLVIAIEREAPMPVYDYVCHDCHKTFELILTLREHEADAKCPKCGSKNVEQEATAFYAVTGKKS
jgi:putative FmdB family regulatory protein